MADRTGGGTSLRGMRERMVAAAHAMAAERRSLSTVYTQQMATTNSKSTNKPILDGSVLKNDEKQRLAKERREEKRRRDDASKETQLLEKERKSKMYQEKQIEEKQRKLKEQKERDEQRRMSVEEKRKQMLEEEQERYKAVLSRSVDHSTSNMDSKKRWSWEGPVVEEKSTENKDGKMFRRSSSLSRKFKIQHTSDKNQLDRRSSGTHGLVQHMARSNHSQSTHEVKPVIVIPTSSMYETGTSDRHDKKPTTKSTKVHHNKNSRKVTRKSRGQDPVKGGLHPPMRVIISPKKEVSSKVNHRPSLPAIGRSSQDDQKTSVANKIACKTDSEGRPVTRVESSLGGRLDTSSEVSTESSAAFSVHPSPEVSIDSSGDNSGDTSPELSVEISPEASLIEVPPGVKVEVLEHPIELPCVQYEEQMNPQSEPATDGIAVPTSDMKNARQKSSQLIKQQLTSSISSYTCPSLPSGASQPPSHPLSIQKIPVSPMGSKTPGPFSLSYKVTPVQKLINEDKVIHTSEKKNDAAFKSKIVAQDLGNQTIPGIVNKEEATKMSTDSSQSCIIREQKEQEQQKDESADEKKFVHLQSQKEDMPEGLLLQTADDNILPKVCVSPQEQLFATITTNTVAGNQKKGDARVKAQEEADKRKKEHERIMLQNLKERLERKKRIEEIMKRTRKTDRNPAKVAETMGKAEEADDEDEADDEEESDSETGLSDDASSSDPTSTQLRPGTTVFSEEKPAQPTSNKGAMAMTKDARKPSKRKGIHKSNRSKSFEANKSLESSKGVSALAQEWYCSTVIDMSNDAETISRRAAHIKKYHPRGSLAACQNPATNENTTAESEK